MRASLSECAAKRQALVCPTIGASAGKRLDSLQPRDGDEAGAAGWKRKFLSVTAADGASCYVVIHSEQATAVDFETGVELVTA